MPLSSKNTAPAGHRAVIYVRESLDSWQDARAVERFEQDCRRLCAARDLSVIRVLTDNDVRASSGNKGDGFAEVKRMIGARETDFVVIPVIDRMMRNMRDLEDVIDLCMASGVVLIAANGDIDLSHDQGRLNARILTSVARAETERKAARHKAANRQAAEKGQRRHGAHRPFGWDVKVQHGGHAPDEACSTRGGCRRVYTPRKPEADAIAWAADSLLGGVTLTAVKREWDRRGLMPVQAHLRSKPGQQYAGKFSLNSVRAVLTNPANAGLSAYKGELMYGAADGQPVRLAGPDGKPAEIISLAKWEQVCALLDDPARKRSQGVRRLLGGMALCPCGNTVLGSLSSQGKLIYRCNPATRNGRPGPHVTTRSEPVDAYVQRVMLHVLASPGLADLVTPPDTGTDTAALRAEAASLRAKMEGDGVREMRGELTASQLRARTKYAQERLAEIAAELHAATGSSAVTPYAAAVEAAGPEYQERRGAAGRVWEDTDLSGRSALIRALATVTLMPPGRGSRVFSPANVRIVTAAGQHLTDADAGAEVSGTPGRHAA